MAACCDEVGQELLATADETLARLRRHRDECRTGGPQAQGRLLLGNWRERNEALMRDLCVAYGVISDYEAGQKEQLRKLALAALQLFANATAGHAYNAEHVMAEWCPYDLLDWLENFSSDRKLCMTVCVILHNGLACCANKEWAARRPFVFDDDSDQKPETGTLLCKLLRLVIPPATTKATKEEKGEEEEEEDPLFEWVYLILLKILEAEHGKDAFLLSGVKTEELRELFTEIDEEMQRSKKSNMERGGEEEELTEEEKAEFALTRSLVPFFTAEQLVLLNLFEHMLGDSHVNGTKNAQEGHVLLRDDGAMLGELVDRVSMWLEATTGVGETTTTNSAAGVVYPEVLMMEEAVATTLRILGEVLALEEEEGMGGGRRVASVRDRLVEQGLVRLVLALLEREGGKADGVIPPMQGTAAAAAGSATTGGETASCGREGRKAQLIRVLGNVCHGCPAAQEEVRVRGGLPLILNHCNVDSANPMLREWALFLVRNLCEGNAANQEAIAALQPQAAVQSEALKEMRMAPRLVVGEDGKPRVNVAAVGEGKG